MPCGGRNIYILKLNVTFCKCFTVSVQNMVAYVTLVIVIFVLVYSLIIGEVAVTFPDTSCFIPCWNTLCWSDFLHSIFVVFKYKVFISDNIYTDINVSVIG